MIITKLLRIRGHVQGVFFRESMSREARHLKINGWVRNRSDGTVEAMVQGAPAQIDQIINWAHRGPSHAHVEQVDIQDAEGAYTVFERLPTL